MLSTYYKSNYFFNAEHTLGILVVNFIVLEKIFQYR